MVLLKKRKTGFLAYFQYKFPERLRITNRINCFMLQYTSPEDPLKGKEMDLLV